MNWKKPKNRWNAIILAILGTIAPFPLAGLHKIYLGQFVWGLVYFLLWSTPIPRIAAAIDAVWYFVLSSEQFDQAFNGAPVVTAQTLLAPPPVPAIAAAIRELDQLRAEGLISEGEFEQKRRSLIERL